MRVLCLLVVTGSLFGGVITVDDIFMRGDANHSGAVNIADPIYINNWLFHGGPTPPCMNEADANHDGQVNAADSTALLNWIFNGGPAPSTPGPFATQCSNSSAPVISCLSGCP